MNAEKRSKEFFLERFSCACLTSFVYGVGVSLSLYPPLIPNMGIR